MISAKVIGKEIDDNGNIKVKTEYTLTDGTKKIGHTRYNFANFSKAKVIRDMKAHCETLMTKIYGLKRHQELIDEIDLSDTKYSCESVDLTIKKYEIDDNGNITESQETITIDDK